MKYSTLILGAVLLLASIVAARAENIIPAPYRGTWCETANHGNVNIYKRCHEITGEQDTEIQSRLITNGESDCVPVAVVAKGNAISVRMECRTASWKGVVIQEFQLSADGQRLTTRN